MKIRIETKTIKGSTLQPGDLFSMAKEDHWRGVNEYDGEHMPVGEKVYIRTNAPSPLSQEELDAEVTLVTFSYVSDDMQDLQPGTKLHHESFHVDSDMDEDGKRIMVETANPNCPYCIGMLAINPQLQGDPAPSVWDGKGAHPYDPVVKGNREGPCKLCRENERMGNHQLQPAKDPNKCWSCGGEEWSNTFEAEGREVRECAACGAQTPVPTLNPDLREATDAVSD